jgi:hypothetical protein
MTTAHSPRDTIHRQTRQALTMYGACRTVVNQVVSEWGWMGGEDALVLYTFSAITLYNLMYFLKNKLILMYSFNILISKGTNIEHEPGSAQVRSTRITALPPCLK